MPWLAVFWARAGIALRAIAVATAKLDTLFIVTSVVIFQTQRVKF
jgi:hypothetical protein